MIRRVCKIGVALCVAVIVLGTPSVAAAEGETPPLPPEVSWVIAELEQHTDGPPVCC